MDGAGLYWTDLLQLGLNVPDQEDAAIVACCDWLQTRQTPQDEEKAT
jgi:hypothetical protein